MSSARLRLIALTTAIGALSSGGVSLPAQEWRTLEASRSLATAGNGDTLHVRLGYVAGKLALGAANRGTLYDLTVRYDADERRVKYSYDPSSRLLTVGGDSGFAKTFAIRHDHDDADRKGPSPSLALKVASGIPLDLSLRFSAADAVLDLSGLDVSRLSVEAAASGGRITFGTPNASSIPNAELRATAAGLEVAQLGNARVDTVRANATLGHIELDLGGDWTGRTALDLDAVLGVITVRVPGDVGVKVDASTTLGSVETPGFTARDGALYSDNWASAKRSVTIGGRAVLGRVEVRRSE
ncbi:MAG TPA: LiaF domain-containing protein [Gemmatimonadaceae bacterium]|jgi:hypothetical protein|nr:LiaF domain-containing protein [Gemmatimonadaceae bacterium]